MWKKRVWVGALALFIGLTPIITFLFALKPHYIVWFSNHTFIIIGLALLFRSPFWLFAEMCIGFIPEAIWSIDFISRVLINRHVWDFTSYMFTETGAFRWVHLYSLQHLLFVPFCIYGLILLGGPVKSAWKGSFIHISIIWALSFLFEAKLNLNCVISDCGVINLPYYPFTRLLL